MTRYELYHYGVKGMRWGVRKSPEERLKQYTSREIDKVKARRMKEEKREDRKIRKRQYKYDQILSDKGGDDGSRKVDRAANKLVKAKADSYTNSAIAKREIKKLSSMKYEDMSEEKRKVGGAILRSALITVGTTTLSATTGFPIRVYSFPLVNNVKSHNRVDTRTRIDLADKNYKKAANDVRG